MDTSAPIPLQSPPERHARSWLAYTNYQLDPQQIQLQLQTAKVAIIGLGGLGGYILEHLVRLGVGQFRLVDPDKFSSSNLNRQLLCTNNNLGRSKVQVARERALSLDRKVSLETCPYLADETNLPEILQNVTVAVDALDCIPSRFKLVQAAKPLNIPVVYGAVSGCYGQASVILPGDTTLDLIYPNFCYNFDNSNNNPNLSPNLNASNNANLENTLKGNTLNDSNNNIVGIAPKNQTLGILSPIVGAIAAIQAQEVFKLITGQPDTLQHKLFALDLMQNFCQILDLTPNHNS